MASPFTGPDYIIALAKQLKAANPEYSWVEHFGDFAAELVETGELERALNRPAPHERTAIALVLTAVEFNLAQGGADSDLVELLVGLLPWLSRFEEFIFMTRQPVIPGDPHGLDKMPWE